MRKRLFTPDEARESLALLREQIEPTDTAKMGLHDIALDLGIAADHSPYDMMYVAFALTTGAAAVVASDNAFHRHMQAHPDPALAAMVLPLASWALSQRAAP